LILFQIPHVLEHYDEQKGTISLGIEMPRERKGDNDCLNKISFSAILFLIKCPILVIKFKIYTLP
jgi:hypothetical protein